MTINLKEWFQKTARVSRAAAARVAEISREDIDEEADNLGFGGRLRFDELVELMEALDEASEDDTEDEDEPGDDDDDTEDDNA